MIEPSSLTVLSIRRNYLHVIRTQNEILCVQVSEWASERSGAERSSLAERFKAHTAFRHIYLHNLHIKFNDNADDVEIILLIRLGRAYNIIQECTVEIKKLDS